MWLAVWHLCGRLRRPSIVVIAGIVGLDAAEQEVRDWRLLAEVRPAPLSFAWDDRLGGADGAGSFDRTWAVGAGLRWGWGRSGSPGRWLLGGEALLLSETSDGLEGHGILLRGEGGYGYALGERLLLTVLPMAGGGPLRLVYESPATGRVSLSGHALEAGLRLGLRWSLAPDWSLAAEAGWLWWRQRAADAEGTLAMWGHGPIGGLSLVWTAEARPRSLE